MEGLIDLKQEKARPDQVVSEGQRRGGLSLKHTSRGKGLRPITEIINRRDITM